MQSQFTRFMTRKPKDHVELHELIRLLVQWGRKLIKFDIKPGEIRNLKEYYEQTIKPAAKGNTLFEDFYGSHINEIDLESLNLESSNTMKGWTYHLDKLSELGRRLVGDFGFRLGAGFEFLHFSSTEKGPACLSLHCGL